MTTERTAAVVEAGDSQRTPPPPEFHFWLTKSDQGFLIFVCTMLVVVMAVRSYQASRFDASAEILTLTNPDIEYRIDINAARAAELSQLRLIGPVRSEVIVADRKANGPFESLDDLQRVKGIGPITVEKNRRWMRVRDEATIESLGNSSQE